VKAPSFYLAACALSCLTLLVLLTSSWNSSPCYDEPEHVTAGYTQVQRGEFWMNPYHPPLAKELSGMALSLVAWNDPWDHWGQRYKEACIDDLFYRQGNDPQLLIRIARAPLILTSALFVLFFTLALRPQIGPSAALLAGLMLALCPTFLAHGPLVTTDAPATALMFVATALFYAWARYPDRRHTLALGLWTGMAWLVKFSALILPVFYLLYLGLQRAGRKHWRSLGQALLLAGALVGLVYAATPVPQDHQSWYNQRTLKNRQHPLVRLIRASEAIPGLRHYSWYLTGLVSQSRHLTRGHDQPAYVKRTFYQGGRWDFFPTLLASKEPVPWILLVGTALMMTPLWLRRAGPEVRGYLLFSMLFLGVALIARLNLGIRHLLPMYPSLFALTAWFWASYLPGVGWKTFSLYTVSLASVGTATSLALAHPGYLAYFNEAVGGKELGAEIALDSNFDWGIDLYRLALYVEEENIPTIYLYYYGRNHPRAYLKDCYILFPRVPLQPGELLAISAGLYLRCELAVEGKIAPPDDMDLETLRWILSRPRKLRIGDTLWILET